MSVNGYLTRLAMQAIVRSAEKESIKRSVAALRIHLRRHFGTDIGEQLIFGSFSRNTILPRHMDERSDVDYMVVFRNDSYRPQNYLDRLRRFAKHNYNRSQIAQSNPTIKLDLNHITFELVPALDAGWYRYQIPAPTADFMDWMSTDPNDFNDKLTRCNQDNGNKIKQLVRLIKYWNACNGYPFESYELEKMVVDHGYWHLHGLLFSSTTPQLKDFFYDFMGSLDAGWNASANRIARVARAKQLVADARTLENNNRPLAAERRIKQLLPPAGGLLAGLSA